MGARRGGDRGEDWGVRIAHLADLHLGFRAYACLTSGGRNQREVDVASAWAACVDGIIAADVDLVLLAGDVFHSARPGNNAIADAVRGVLRLRQALPNAPILIVQGNHDEPKAEAGSPLRVLALLGAHVFERAGRISVGDVHVLCVPDCDIGSVTLEPGPEPGTHILLAHGAVGGRLAQLGVDVLDPARISLAWQYVALGDYHTVEQIAPNAWYSGAIEYTSSDPWREIGTAKGWLLVDTERGTVEHKAIPTRRYIDLPPVSAHEMSAADATAQLLANIAREPLDGAVVRQVVTDCLPGTDRALDRRAIRKATASALYYQLDVRRPKEYRAGITTIPRFEPAPPEGWPSWEAYDAWCYDAEPAASVDAYDLADAILRGDLPSPAELLADPDPYHLDAPVRQSAAA